MDQTAALVLLGSVGAVYATTLAVGMHLLNTNFRARLAARSQTPASGPRSPGGPLAGPDVDARTSPPTARRRVVWPPLPNGGHTTPHGRAA